MKHLNKSSTFHLFTKIHLWRSWAVLILACVGLKTQAQTLQAGDLALIGLDLTNKAEEVSIVTFIDITSPQTITLWNNKQGRDITATIPVSTAGTVFTASLTSMNFGGASNSISLYRGASTASTDMITAIGYTLGDLPARPTGFTNFVVIGANGQYTGGRSATRNTLIDEVVKSGNYTTGGNIVFNSTAFNVLSTSGLIIDSLAVPRNISFDENVNGISNSAFSGSGFSPLPTTGQLSSEAWRLDGPAANTLAFNGIASTGIYARGTSTGGVITDGIYAFEVTSGNQTLGIEPPQGDSLIIDLKVNNLTGSSVNHVFLEYDVYIRNDDDLSSSLFLAYSTDGINYTKVNGAKIITPDTKDASPAWQINPVKKLFNFGGQSNLSNDSVIYFRWIATAQTGSGNGDEIAIDSIKVCMFDGPPTLQPYTLSSGKYSRLAFDGIDAEINSDSVEVESMSLQNSKLRLKGNTLIIGDTLEGANANAYIIPGQNGKVRKKFKNKGKFTYPVGTEAGYRPITLDFSSGNFNADSSWVEIKYTEGKHPELDSLGATDYINGFWTIDEKAVTNFSCNIEAVFSASDVVGNVNNIITGKYSLVNGQEILTVGDLVSGDTLRYDTASGFSDIIGGGLDALPVSWLAFEGQVLENVNYLEWLTAQEVNNSHFLVERTSSDADQFEIIGRVEGNGTTSAISKYSFVDQTPIQDAVYRIKQIDFDGKFDYSKYIRIYRGQEERSYNEFTIYPNPANKSLSLNVNLESSENEIIVYDLNMKEVITQEDYKNNDQIDVSLLPEGAYWLELRTQDRVVGRKIFMIKH